MNVMSLDNQILVYDIPAFGEFRSHKARYSKLLHKTGLHNTIDQPHPFLMRLFYFLTSFWPKPRIGRYRN